jgi:hypothetical protein
VAAYREEKTDPGIFREMGEMGLLGATVPGNTAAWAHPTSPMA